MTLRAVIFDYKTLTGLDSDTAADAGRLLEQLADWGIGWILFTSDPLSGSQQAELADYPPPADHIQRADIPGRKARGSQDWIDVAADRLDLARHELLYVGQTEWDWYTAVNAGVLYLHALWSGPQPVKVKAIVADYPADVADFIADFLPEEPIWYNRIDQGRWTLRSLLPAGASLKSSTGPFTLQQVFKYDRKYRVGAYDARDLLVLTALTFLYLEGLVPARSYICIYPSSTPGRVSEQLADFLKNAASLFGGYYREDLLIRGNAAPDTSVERDKANRGLPAKAVSIVTQATTVHVNPAYRDRNTLGGRTVVVVDDFTTRGFSLEWARILLEAAGAEDVVMVALGKYGTTHTRFEPRHPDEVTPFELNSLDLADFRQIRLESVADHDAEPSILETMRAVIKRDR